MKLIGICLLVWLVQACAAELLDMGIMDEIDNVRSSAPAHFQKIPSSMWLAAGYQGVPEHLRSFFSAPFPSSMVVNGEAAAIESVMSRKRSTVNVALGGTVSVPSDVNLLLELVMHDGVYSVEAPETMIVHTEPTVISAHRIDVIRALYQHSTGAGVTIGVISNGVDSLSAMQTAGHLPHVTVIGAGSGDEGTAMLQIIHSIAPDATLYFATAGVSQSAFTAAILNLAVNCSIIVDDILFLAESVYQDGLPAQTVNSITANGTVYLSAAGNFGNSWNGASHTFEADYVPIGPNSTNIRDFMDFGGATPYMAFIVSLGGAVTFMLHWSDKYSAPNATFQMIITNTTGFPLAVGTITGVAYQEITLTMNTGTYHLYIGRRNTSDLHIRHISLRVYTPGFDAVTLDESTVGATYGHAAAAGAIGVGAIGLPDSGNYVSQDEAEVFQMAEAFSSDGPRRILYYSNSTAITPGVFNSSAGVLRNKPDVLAANGITTNVPGFSTFYGTSASAAVAAGLAALAKGAKPDADIRALLVARVVDLSCPGWGTATGLGVMDAAIALSGSAPIVVVSSATTLVVGIQLVLLTCLIHVIHTYST